MIYCRDLKPWRELSSHLGQCRFWRRTQNWSLGREKGTSELSQNELSPRSVALVVRVLQEKLVPITELNKLLTQESEKLRETRLVAGGAMGLAAAPRPQDEPTNLNDGNCNSPASRQCKG